MVDGTSTPDGGEPVDAGSVTAAIVALLRAYPGGDASTGQRAVWFARKAAVLARIADEGGPDAGEARALADAAEAQAVALGGEAR